ncbi:glycoside hydrolase family 19 protein [Serratia aquatilis]|uniref:Glycoside hydrolase family 19 protein n=1 Tax=Serratia aquatilis TaxID=1737515 RepID=A0ABV6EGD8_9GAMM
MTQDQFQRAAGISAGLATRWFPHVEATFNAFSIATPIEQAMFIAQIGHESAGFTASVESFNYSQRSLKTTFGHRLSPDQIAMLGRQAGEKSVPLNRQKAIANLVYGGRMGNKAPGDGWRYRGRGPMQLTGLDNYRACSTGLKLDLVGQPELLELDIHAMHSAGWFWQSRNCGKCARDIECVTRLINGGLNGIDDRKARFELAKKVLVGNTA